MAQGHLVVGVGSKGRTCVENTHSWSFTLKTKQKHRLEYLDFVAAVGEVWDHCVRAMLENLGGE